MLTYKQLYTRAVKKGKLLKSEYSVSEYLIDINELGRKLWTTIFQGVNGNKPKITRSEEVTTNTLSYTHTRTIKKTPIQKIVFESCTIIPQRTDKVDLCGCTSFEYDDDEIRFLNAIDGKYTVFYEAGEYTEVTQTQYDADAKPDWIKDDFVPLFWTWCALQETDKEKESMIDLYKMYLNDFEHYYNRTESLEDHYLIADDTQDQI